MASKEVDKFHGIDDKKYIVKSNKEFLDEVDACNRLGYKSVLNLDTYQDLIDYVTMWFEKSYTDNDYSEWSSDYTKCVDIKYLLDKFPIEFVNFMKCRYRHHCYGVINDKTCVHFTMKNKNENKIITASFDVDTGMGNCSLYDRDEVHIEEVYSNLSFGCNYNIDELHDCMINKCLDINMRRVVFKLIVLKLLFSSTSSKEISYERAKRFIYEVNSSLGTDISLEEIDNIYNNYEDIYDDRLKHSSIFKRLLYKIKTA